MSTKQYKPKLKANEHQLEAIKKMSSAKLANFDDQGLGKTKQCYDTIAQYFSKKEIDLAIIVAKASLRDNFSNEVKNDAFQLRVNVIAGSKRDRLDSYRHLAHHVLIISYETLISDVVSLSSLCKINRVLIAFDESHYLKNIKSKRAQAAIDVASHCKKSLIFSGTPAPNGIEDLFPQLKILGFEVGDTIDDFKKRFQNPEALKEFIGDKFIRRKKEELKSLNLPKKKVHIHTVPLSKKEILAYENLKIGALESLKTNRPLNLSNVLSKLSYLHQFTSNPELLGTDIPGSKYLKLQELLKKYLATGKKVIVWTTYRHNVQKIASDFSFADPVILIGGLKRDQRKKNALRFQDDPNCQLMIATPACAREGFTLTSAHVAIYLDRSFSYLDWAQSQDRIHRISQKKECHIICLQASNTLDEKIDEILDLKGDLQAYLLGDSTVAPKATITYEQLIKILS